MKSETAELTQVMNAIAALRDELARLGARVAALEAPGPAQPQPQPQPAPAPPPKPRSEGIDEGLVIAISAAVAAFLGCKPRIKHIRLVGTASWAQQGRAIIQASHAINVPHTRS